MDDLDGATNVVLFLNVFNTYPENIHFIGGLLSANYVLIHMKVEIVEKLIEKINDTLYKQIKKKIFPKEPNLLL